MKVLILIEMRDACWAEKWVQAHHPGRRMAATTTENLAENRVINVQKI